MINLYVIKTEKGYYISDRPTGWDSDLLKGCYIDGELPKATFDKHWFFVKNKPKIIEKEISQSSINYRYELIDKSMKTDKIKMVFKREDVAELNNYEWIWKDAYAHLESLYQLECDEQPDIKEKIEFEIEVVYEIKKLDEPKDFHYRILEKRGFGASKKTEINRDDIQHQLIDKIVFPSIMQHLTPSVLTSEQTYHIVKAYIKDNINPYYAEITSDYDFCFAVAKKIRLLEHEKYTIDVNASWFSKRKRKPKYETRYHKNRKIQIFEMTHKGDNYKNYTAIKGFEGKDEKDLKEKIDYYLKCLIECINKPLTECPKCKGNGVIIDEKVI